MKYPNQILVIAMLGICTGLSAQITVTNATFPAVNDTVFYAFDANSSPIQIITPPGFNQTWNLSGLQPNQPSSTVYRHPSMGVHSANFPGADLLVIEPGRELYYNVTNDKVELMGYYGSDPIGIGINLLALYAPPAVERRDSMNFFDINQIGTGLLLPFAAGDAPANFLQQLPVTPDSLRIRTSLNRLDVVDAWGTLSIPGGCYEVLREKRTTYEEKRLDAKIPPLGWLDITDIAIQSLGMQLGVDTTVEYHFFGAVDKQQIAVVRLNNAQNGVEFVRFKHPDNSQFSISNIATTPESCANANNGSITVTTTGGTGTLTYAISGPVNQNNSTGVFTALPDGNYSISVTSSIIPCPVSGVATVAAGGALSITCPAPQTLALGANCSATLPNYTGLAGTSNCGVQSVTQSPAAGTVVSSTGNMTVTLTVTDVANNVQQCTFTVTKVDNTPPIAACINSTVNFNGQQSVALNATDLVTATDNCGVQSISLSPNSISVMQVGQVVPVTVTVADINGNMATCTSQVTASGLPPGWSQPAGPVGCTNCTGNFVFNPSNGIWTGSATGATYNPTSASDAMMIAGRTLCGDGSITVRVTSITGLGWAGIVMRETNDPGAKKAQLMTNLGNFHRRDFRTITNNAATSNQSNSSNRFWLRIVRTGNSFQLWSSANGIIWVPSASTTISMNSCIQMGLVATGINNNASTTATFSNVSFAQVNPNVGGQAQIQPTLGQVEFDVFPNPTSGELNLDLTRYIGRSVRIETYSLEGKLLQSSEIEEVQAAVEQLNLKSLSGGMYLVKLKSAGLPDATRRIVVNRN
jgi:hypothetical protein